MLFGQCPLSFFEHNNCQNPRLLMCFPQRLFLPSRHYPSLSVLPFAFLFCFSVLPWPVEVLFHVAVNFVGHFIVPCFLNNIVLYIEVSIELSLKMFTSFILFVYIALQISETK